MRVVLVLLLLTSTAWGMEKDRRVWESGKPVPYESDRDLVLYAGPKHESRQELSQPLFYQKPEESVISYEDVSSDVKVSSCVEYNGECKESEAFQASVK